MILKYRHFDLTIDQFNRVNEFFPQCKRFLTADRLKFRVLVKFRLQIADWQDVDQVCGPVCKLPRYLVVKSGLTVEDRIIG